MNRYLSEYLTPEEAEKLWQQLEDACDRISKGDVNNLSFQDVYNCCYKLILHKFREFTYKRLQHTLTRISVELIRENINSNKKDTLLSDFVKTYEAQQSLSKSISDVCLYMEKNYIIPENLPTIKSLCNENFRCLFLDSYLKDSLVECFILAIRNDRNHLQIEKFKLKQALYILIDINTKQQIKKQSQYIYNIDYITDEEIYRNLFEKKLLKETTRYYQEETLRLKPQMSIQEFVQEIERRLQEETERVQAYLPKSSQNKILDCYIQCCITQNCEYICEGLFQFIENENIEVIQRIYNLFIKSEKAHDQFLRTLQQYIKVKGVELQKNKNAETLKGFIELSQKVTYIADQLQGNNDQKYKVCQAIQFIFLQLINQDYFILNELNKYFDHLMRRESNDDNRKRIQEGFLIFKYIQSKDLFEIRYRYLLSQRLLDSTYASKEQEKQMVIDLKKESGSQLTQKMETMFSDLERSRSESIDFKLHLEHLYRRKTEDPIDVEIYILTSGQWPIPDLLQLQLSEELQNYRLIFENYYRNKYQNRKLDWHYCLGQVNLRAIYNINNKKEFICSIIQATILLHFNTKRIYKFYELQQLLQLDIEQLQQELDLLCNQKLLLRSDQLNNQINEEKKSFEQQLSQSQQEYILNSQFSSKQYKIKITHKKVVDLQSSAKKQEKNNQNQIQGFKNEVIEKDIIIDRKMYLESLIVKILKARKQLEHKELLRELDKDSKNRLFALETNMLKECIQNLIQKDYLIRQEGAHDLYIYRA